MNDEQLRTTVLKVLSRIAPETDPSSLPPDANLQDELDIDSIDFLSFMMGLHEETGIDVPERDYPQVATLAGVVAYLRTHGA